MFQRKDLEQKLIEKALKDEAFRKQLIENPEVAIEQEMGMKIPEPMKINILEEDPQTIYLVLPYVPSSETPVELSETELLQVAGAIFPPCVGDSHHNPTFNCTIPRITC